MLGIVVGLLVREHELQVDFGLLLEQLPMRARVNHFAFVHDEDVVELAQQGKVVRDHYKAHAMLARKFQQLQGNEEKNDIKRHREKQ